MTPSDCTDYFTLADGTRVCTARPHDSPHCFCENLVKNEMCPKGVEMTNPKPLTQPRKGEPNHGKASYQPGSLHTTDLPMQPSLGMQQRTITKGSVVTTRINADINDVINCPKIGEAVKIHDCVLTDCNYEKGHLICTGKSYVHCSFFEGVHPSLKEQMQQVHPTTAVKIHCPVCGWQQEVEENMWKFQSSPVGHGYTCGSGKCPSHTAMVFGPGPRSLSMDKMPMAERFPQLPADATMHDRLMRDEEILKYINGDLK